MRVCSGPLRPKARLPTLSEPGQLLDVVHQAVELPLRADLRLAPQREPVHVLVVPDVGEHRFHGGEAPAVEAAAPR